MNRSIMNQWQWAPLSEPPLVQRATLALHELVNEPFVMYARSTKRASFDEFIALCHLARFSPNIV